MKDFDQLTEYFSTKLARSVKVDQSHQYWTASDKEKIPGTIKIIGHGAGIMIVVVIKDINSIGTLILELETQLTLFWGSSISHLQFSAIHQFPKYIGIKSGCL